MVEINLFPWRAYLRARQKKKKTRVILCALIVSVVILFFAKNFFYSSGKSIPNSAPPALSLEKIPFRLAGFFSRDGKYWALVVFSNGKLADVSLGDSVGHHWRVIGIDDAKVIVEKGSRRVSVGYFR